MYLIWLGIAVERHGVILSTDFGSLAIALTTMYRTRKCFVYDVLQGLPTRVHLISLYSAITCRVADLAVAAVGEQLCPTGTGGGEGGPRGIVE